MNRREQHIIAGPCAMETQAHAEQTIAQAKLQGIETVRMNLWKPRTKPGYEGAGEAGIPWVKLAAEQGLTPAMEVIMPWQAELLMNEVLTISPHATLLIWIGSRNQNHTVQTDIGRVVAGEERVKLMLKNQPWRDADHWRGIVEHVMNGGATQSQLSLCHRGFAPVDKATSETRNVADMEMAVNLKHELNLPLILDPSHIGGQRQIVKRLIQEFATHPEVDGQIIEVHPDPAVALTDQKQQLTWSELETLLSEQEEV